MGKRLAIVIALVALSALALSVQASTAAQPRDQRINRVFSQPADHGAMKPIKGKHRFALKLVGVGPRVNWVSDRPPPRSGHIPVSSFLDSWSGFGFADDAPNAALRLRHADARHDTVIVRLGEPRFRLEQHNKRTTRTVRYPARILGRATGNLSYLESKRDRSVARSFGAASLLIDDASAPVVNGCPIEPYTACPGANLVGAGLAGADLTGALLTRAEMADADLSGAELSGAVLNYANLGDADLSDADLSDANLRQANLALATVTGADLSGAVFCNTTMPDGSVNNSSCQASSGG